MKTAANSNSYLMVSIFIWLNCLGSTIAYSVDFSRSPVGQDLSSYTKDDRGSLTPAENEVRSFVLGRDPVYSQVRDNMETSFNAYDVNYTARTPADYILGVSLQTDVRDWGLRKGLTEEKIMEVYTSFLFELEKRVLASGEHFYFDVKGFDVSDGMFVSNLGRQHVKMVITEESIRSSVIDEQYLESIAEYLAKDNRITAREFRLIDTIPEIKAKTVLSWNGVPLESRQANVIISRVREINENHSGAHAYGWGEAERNPADAAHGLKEYACN